ncbi:sigma-54-dependent Fis family transcriptional regulator [Desulfofundulus sp. TPOSR]|uniref:sigma-54-dependent Fis family transcriptional regulator n=1 Tax=Desulfofundulus sp. TPOSR TaxID=2714340 RepID=UPI0028BE5F7E|nr:sigma-54-dependent Fis family transcriptional regulator [Desulfofundulus sp. TPOSR]
MKSLAINKLENTAFLRDELSIFNSVHNMVVAVDYQGRVIIFNPTSERIFNYPAEKALGRPIREVVPFTGLPKVLQTGKPHIGRKFVVGNALYVVNRTPIIRNNTIIGAIGVAQEITELQHLAQELKEIKEVNVLLENIFHSTHEGYIATGNDGRILMINGPMAELLGVTIETAVGRHIREVAPDKRLHQILWSGKLQYGEVVRIRGRETVVMRVPLYNQGKLVGAVSKVMFQDVEQLLALAEKISIQRRSSFCPSVTHNDNPTARYTVDNLIGASRDMLRLKETIRRVAQGPSTVLIRGESGTGKELVAHALHTASPRHRGPFIKVNCAAVPENLLESELFGYQEGAFTGARKGGQIGKFEQADGGTIFLDEIGDMPLPMQAKILRVLQEKEIERLGDTRPRAVDVRVVAATNRDLEELIRQGHFREDLYYRLNVVSLYIPPLRERPDDIPLLVNHFIKKFNREFGLLVRGVSPEVSEILYTYDWPGNVRELENVMERAFNLVEGDIIEVKHMPPYLQKASQGRKRNLHNRTLATLLQEVEKEALLEALAAAGGNKMQAAKTLGISRAWLYKKMKQYDIRG